MKSSCTIVGICYLLSFSGHLNTVEIGMSVWLELCYPCYRQVLEQSGDTAQRSPDTGCGKVVPGARQSER